MDTDETVASRRIGEVLGGTWTLERLLGTGGMAAVYAARDASGTVAAVKLLHPEMTLRSDVRERFLREAYVANRVDHPGAVSVLAHGGGEEGAPAYIVMELLEGQTLADRAKAGMGTAELLDVMDQVLDVLEHAHGQGIVHRDLKPDNLFVCDDGRVKILDFGLARMLDEVPGDFKTRTGMALGTLPYMAPEQALGPRAELDGRADLFALGATAFRIASGRKIHDAPSEAELLMAMASKPAPPLASIAPSVPADVCAIIDLSLAFSKEARYPDARTMQADVRDVRAGRRPGYASSRSAKREEATRLDMPAVVLPPSSTRAPSGGTMPLPAVDAPPPSQSAPAVAAAAAPAVAAVVPAPPRRRNATVVIVLAAAALLVVAVVAVAAVLATRSQAPEAASAAASASEAPAGEVAAPAEPGEAAPAVAPAVATSPSAHAAPHDVTATAATHASPPPAGAAGAPKPPAATGAAPKPAPAPAPAPHAAPTPTPAPPPAPTPAPAPEHGHSNEPHGHGHGH